MLLTDLIAEISTKKILGCENVDIKNICADSRKVTEGDLFVAVNGVAVDGHQYVSTAIEKGAKVIVCQTLPSSLQDGVTYVQVEDSADCLGRLASAYYDYPSEKLIIIGVTGTNGKTTIATLLYELYKELGYKVVIVEGNPQNYRSRGFVRSEDFGIFAAPSVGLPAPECLMVKELEEGALKNIKGSLEYSFYETLR